METSWGLCAQLTREGKVVDAVVDVEMRVHVDPLRSSKIYSLGPPRAAFESRAAFIITFELY